MVVPPPRPLGVQRIDFGRAEDLIEAAYTGHANLSQPPPRAPFETRLRGSGRTAKHGLAAGNRRRGPRVIGPASQTAPPPPARARTSERFRARGGEASPEGRRA